MKSDDGEKEIWPTGQFLQIEPGRKILMSNQPSNSKGDQLSAKVIDHEGPLADYGDSYITVDFEAISSRETKMTLSHERLPARVHDDCVQGWGSSFNKLHQLLEKH